jgi:hypothetical protein
VKGGVEWHGFMKEVKPYESLEKTRKIKGNSVNCPSESMGFWTSSIVWNSK